MMEKCINNFNEWANVWLNDYKKGTVRESTFNTSYKRIVEMYILPEHINDNFSDITALRIRRIFNRLSGLYSKSTLNKIKICYNGIFNSAIENNLCTRNPVQFIKPVSDKDFSQKRTYAQDEVDDILKYCPKHIYGHYIYILLEMGLRASELCGLMWSDFDFENRTLQIMRACTAVNGKSHIDSTKNRSSHRTLPMSKPLTDYLLNIEKNSCFVVPTKSDRNKTMTPSQFSKSYYKNFFESCLMHHKKDFYLTPHELRHTCGTLLYNKSLDIYAVSKFLGHSNITITSKLYVHENVEVLRKSLGIS